jgi:uncharacterized phage protein (TIGR01671 family)
MRTIKFRGFLSVQKRWVYGNLIEDNNGNKYIIETAKFSTDGHHLMYNQDDEPVMIDQDTIGQYICMNDCNDKEIYEGDVVSVVDDGVKKDYVVVFDDDELDFKSTNGNESYGKNFQYLTCCDEVEVLGNAHDNPELMKNLGREYDSRNFY